MVEKISNQIPEVNVSFDLGWVLQNNQISDEWLCSYLHEETSRDIERLVSRFLKSPADRIDAVDRILFKILSKRRLYKNNISGKAWLYRLVFEECLARCWPNSSPERKSLSEIIRVMDLHSLVGDHFQPFLNSLPETQRLLVILQFGQKLTPDEIAVVLKMNLEIVLAELDQAGQSLITHQRSCEECSAHYSTIKGMETALADALRWEDPLFETALQNSAAWSHSLLERLDRGKNNDRNRKWVSRGMEAVLAILVIGIVEWASIHMGNAPLFSEPTPRVVMQVVVASSTPLPKPTTVTSTQSAPVAVENDHSDEILALNRTSQTLWHTLWANIEVNNYNVETYSDGTGSLPGVSIRKQIWISQPGSTRIISGSLQGNPDITFSVTSNHITGVNFDVGQSIDSNATDIIMDGDLQKIIFPIDTLDPEGQFSRMGSDMIAGRPAWVMDWNKKSHTISRYWIDKEYGIVLRRLDYGAGIFQPVISDTIVTKIYYDATFPAAIYAPDKYKGDHFANDFSGNPEIPDLKTALQTWSRPNIEVSPAASAPLVKSNLASAYLTFQNVPAGLIQETDRPSLEVYAGQNDLGKLLLGGKSLLACERSPDGSRIAYNSPPQAGSGDTALFIADLASLRSARPALLDGITAGDFAFSPDNHRLAFFGCEKSSGFCGIFVIDLRTNNLTRMVPLTFADYITWSPDGRSLALVGNDDPNVNYKDLSTKNLLQTELIALLHTWHFLVLDASNGNVTYKKQFDWYNLSAPSDSPTNQWLSPFKVPTVGVKACSNPPDKVN